MKMFNAVFNASRIILQHSLYGNLMTIFVQQLVIFVQQLVTGNINMTM